VKATVTAATSTQLTVTVPIGATYQPITVTETSTELTAYSYQPFVVTFSSSHAIDASSFATKIDSTTGSNPYDVAIADLDGDGKPDVVVTDEFSGAFSVYRNTSTNGDISFAQRADFATGNGPAGIAVGDIDGDGKLDLVVANSSNNTVSVYRNTSTNGSISFAPRVDFATGSEPFGLAIGDIDGDGKPDIVVTNWQDSTVSVLRNMSSSGSISFASKVNFASGTNPHGAAIGDLDGDGKPDVVVTNGVGNTVSVYRNVSTSGSIQLAPKVDFSTGVLAYYLVIADVDGDGKPDLVVANTGPVTVSVLRNTSTSGSISFASKVDLATTSNPSGVAMGDIDGDGKLDLVVANYNSSTLSVFRNTSSSGAISFGSKVDFGTGSHPWCIAMGDIDGDGRPDIVVTNSTSNTISVFRNTVSASAAIPVIPTLSSPANGSTRVATNLTFSWNTSTGATSYRLQVSTDSTFATTIYDTSGLSTTTKSIAGLSYLTEYYWRVNATNTGGTSGWSEVWNFTTSNQPLWTQINNGLTNSVVVSLAINSSGYIFAGTDSDGSGGVCLSTNNGTSWTSVSNGLPSSPNISRLTINSSGYIFAGAHTGLYLSTNNGTSWTAVNNGLPSSQNIVSLAINSSGYIFAGTGGGTGIYLSTNNGATWTQTGLTNKGVGSLAINSSGYIFAGTNGGVYLSTNNGASWTNVGLTSRAVYSLAINSSGYVFAGTDTAGVYLSTNNGASWTQLNNGLAINSVWSLAISSSGYIFAGTLGNGVYLSTNNGTSWTQVNNGLMINVVWSLAVSSSGYIFAGTGSGIYRASITSLVTLILAAPTLASPVNGSTEVAINPALTWNASTGATNYRLQVSMDSTFAMTTYDTSGLTGTSKSMSGLSYLTKYYWRVNASNTGGTSAWSATWNFTTIVSPHAPPAPTLASPTTGSTGVSVSPTLSWNASSGATTYRLQVSIDSTFATTTCDTSGLTTTSKSITGLSPQTEYYWRVNATDSAGTSGWSTVWNFTTIVSPPLAPTLASPSNGSAGVSTNPTLTWNTSTGVSSSLLSVAKRAVAKKGGKLLKVNQTGLSYRIQISTDSTFVTGVYVDTTVADTSLVVSGLSPQTKYHWRVNASDSAGTSLWSSIWSFTTGTQLAWTQMNIGLTNTYVYSLGVNSSGYLFAGTTGGGVYRSTNNGGTWTQAGLTTTDVNSFAFNSSGYIFAGTSNAGVYLSTNNGDIWTQANSGLINNEVYVGCLGVNSSGYIFASTSSSNGGIYLSTNNGTDWTQANNGLTNIDVTSFAFNPSGYIFAGTSNAGVYLSTNNGTDWTQANNGLTNIDVTSLALNSSGYIFAGTNVGVYLSTNNGNSWTQMGLTGVDVVSLAINSSEYVFAGTIGGAYLSTNNGATWSKVDSGLTNTDVYCLTINSSGYVFAGTYGGGVFRADRFATAFPPPIPQLVTPSNGSSGAPTVATLTWRASAGASHYELQVSADSTFVATFLDTSYVVTTSQTVRGLSRGLTYYWRVNASNSIGTSGWSSVWSFTTFTYPSSVQVSTQYTPPNTMDSTSYRIIGMPGTVDVPIGNLMSGKEGSDWRAFYNNGANQNYYVEYDGTSAFDFQPGRAFWILSRNPFSVSQNASTVSIDTADSYPISIHGGWNLISNPFEKSVSWSSVEKMNGTTQPIYAFSNGSYTQPDTMDPYEGYYFYNDTTVSQLRIPYVYSSVPASVANQATVTDQHVVVALSDGNKSLSSIAVGVKSAPGIKSANIFAPPGNFQRSRICVVDSAIGAGWKELIKDYRDTIGTGQQFDFYVTNKTGKSLKLTPNVADGLSKYEVYLIDKDLFRSYNLKDSQQISIPSYDKLKNYSVLIGSKSFIDAKLADLLPKGYMLYQNYPNPFNPVTVIRFEVPKAERVSLSVYDILGRRVETLMNANVTPGYYEIPFDGTNLASGVYFYRLSAGSFKQVKKMVLLK
jgi:hypothetical protein